MAQPRRKTTTTKRQSGSFIYPQQSVNMGVGVTVGIASTAIITNTGDFGFKGLHHLHSPIEAIVHVIGQGGNGGGDSCGRAGGGGGGGYIRAKIDSVNGKRFIATVTRDSTPPSGFWFTATEYASAIKGSNGGPGGGDSDPGRGISCSGGGAGGGGGSTLSPLTSIFSSLQATSGSNGGGGSGTHGSPDGTHHGPPGAGGAAGFTNAIGPSHPFAPVYGRGGAGGPSPGQDGAIIVETPGRPAFMRGGGYPTGGYQLS